MYIKSLTLHNIKRYADFTINFLDEENNPRLWTSILGENGVGKTTLLQCIAISLVGGSSLNELLPYPENWVRKDKEYGYIDVTIIFPADELPEKKSPNELKIRYYVVGKNGAEIHNQFYDGPRIIEPINQINYSYFKRNVKDKKLFVAGYGIHREYSSTKLSTEVKRNPRTTRIESLFVSKVFVKNLEDWLKELEYKSFKTNNKSSKELLEKAFAATQKILPNVNNVEIKSDGKLYVTTNSGELPITELSDAYLSLFSWTGDLMMQLFENYADLEDPTKGTGVVIIDELGLYMHPSAQRKIVDWLKEIYPNIQFIVSSHSPFIAQASNEGEIFILTDTNGKTNLTPYKESFRGLPIEDVFTNLFHMKTTRDLSTEEKLTQYDKLLLESYKNNFNRSKKQDLDAVKNQLDNSIPKHVSNLTAEKKQEISEIVEKIKKLASEI